MFNYFKTHIPSQGIEEKIGGSHKKEIDSRTTY